MSNKPVWALGYALRMAGVPCAEEIAMMLTKKKQPTEPVAADTPYATDTMEVLGGSYVDAVYFNADGKNESTAAFAVGDFPLEQSFNWYYHWGWPTAYGTNQAYLKLQLLDLEWSHKVGDFIKLRYLLPTVTGCSFYQSEGLTSYSPEYYSFVMELVSSSADGGKPALYTITHSGADGSLSFCDYGETDTENYTPLFSGSSLVPTTSGNALEGLELSGRLLQTVDAVNITITGHASGTYNNAALTVEYADSNCLTVEAYENVNETEVNG